MAGVPNETDRLMGPVPVEGANGYVLTGYPSPRMPALIEEHNGAALDTSQRSSSRSNGTVSTRADKEILLYNRSQLNTIGVLGMALFKSHSPPSARPIERLIGNCCRSRIVW